MPVALLTNWRSWVLAARPPTLWAAVAPVLVGSALAVRDGVFRGDAFVVIMVAALLIQIGVNFANDVADGTRGADDHRIGPTRAVASGLITPGQMWRGIAITFGLAGVAGIYLVELGGPWILVIGVASILAALGYTNGPIPYGYYGLGEIFVFVFFGLVATVGTRFVYDRSTDVATFTGGVAMGLLATAILLANNVRDEGTDRIAGKQTLAVILGRTTGVVLYGLALLGAFGVIAVAAAAGWMPASVLLVLIALPPGIPLIVTLYRETTGPPLIGALKGTARLQIAFGVLLSIGIVW